MSATSLWLMALATVVIEANVIVDDNTCYRNKVRGVCEPESLCEFNFNIGDLNFDQSYRVKEGVNFYPQQIHLAFGGKRTGTAMTVSWTTFEDVTDSSVWVGDTEDTLELVDTPVSSVSYYSDDKYNLFHHHATVTGLRPRTKYFYKVGSRGDENYTDISSFITARPASDDRIFNVQIYGDLGRHRPRVPPYADNDFVTLNQAAGFFYEEVYNSMMPLMSRVPYMVLVGNHETECHSPRCQASRTKSKALGNYTAYNTRFKMPYEESSGTSNMWHSFDHGPIHFTSLSSESDYPSAPSNVFILWTDNGNFGDQLSWLEADLKKADANCANVPWIFVGMHRPIYSVLDSENDIPTGQTADIHAAFETLVLQYKVDVVFAGHHHYYERHLPIARSQAVLDEVSKDYKMYDNPHAPVYIITGGAGQSEGMSKSPTNSASWNAASDYEHFGYSMLEVNRTTLVWKYILSSDCRL